MKTLGRRYKRGTGNDKLRERKKRFLQFIVIKIERSLRMYEGIEKQN